MLIKVISINLDELFKDCNFTSATFDGEPGGVMEVTKDLLIVLIITILRTKDKVTNGASEMIGVIFFAACGYVGTA